MAAALVGRKWDAVPIEVLFYRRESLATLSPQAFRAYLPAYLVACLASDDPFDKHGADIRGYLLFALGSWPHQSDPDRPAETRERFPSPLSEALHRTATCIRVPTDPARRLFAVSTQVGEAFRARVVCWLCAFTSWRNVETSTSSASRR